MPARKRSPKALVVSLLACLAFGLALPSPSLAAEKGTVPDFGWGTTRAQVDQTVSLMQEAGVQWVAVNAAWNAYEQNGKGNYNSGYISDVDYAVGKARAAGIKVMIAVQDGTPYWASADPLKFTDVGGGHHWNSHYKPHNYQDYADFYRWVVNHYKPYGIDHYQIWNEPNLSWAWPSGPNAADYTQMVRAAYPAIKAADPDATVIAGAVAGNDHKFVDQMYTAGAKGYFDVISVHPYTCSTPPESIWNDSDGRISKDAFPGYREVHDSMLANGDDKPIWFTEFGWSTNNAVCPTTEAQQADWMVRALRYVEQDPYVQVALQYNFRNTYFPTDDWNGNLGLLRVDFSKKPAFDAFRDYSPGSSPPPPSGPPTVKLTQPADGSTFTSSLPVSADAAGGSGIAKVEFWIGGKLRATDTSAPYSFTWKSGKHDAYTTYKVEARAYDSSGQTATDSVSVTRVKTTSTSVRAMNKVSGANGTLVATPVRGDVIGPSSGSVTIILEKLRPDGSWKYKATPDARFKRGKFSKRLRRLLHRGLWRVSVSYAGARGFAPSHSGYRYFRI